jgi:zinc/manganese transport system permease protein
VSDLLALLWAPLLMCLVLTGIHAYLGLHVLAREVIFVDIALAQIAALGATAAFLAGFELESPVSYYFGLGATLAGALVLALTRSRERHVSQEAVIGVVYAVSAAGTVLLLARAPHGAEHLRAVLVGNILTVSGGDVVRVAALYAGIGALHWVCRRPFFLISTAPDTAFDQGWRVRRWDFLFYATFGLVVTSSVRIAGVLLVFSYLIVPALAAMTVGGPVAARLAVGWTLGSVVSVAGIAASAALDLPTGATVVCAFGLALLAFWGLARRRGWRPQALDAPAGGARAPIRPGSRP